MGDGFVEGISAAVEAGATYRAEKLLRPLAH
jgi:hypothetical protein